MNRSESWVMGFYGFVLDFVNASCVLLWIHLKVHIRNIKLLSDEYIYQV